MSAAMAVQIRRGLAIVTVDVVADGRDEPIRMTGRTAKPLLSPIAKHVNIKRVRSGACIVNCAEKGSRLLMAAFLLLETLLFKHRYVALH
jgi:hypothetical protein